MVKVKINRCRCTNCIFVLKDAAVSYLIRTILTVSTPFSFGISCESYESSASVVTTFWRYTNLFIIFIITVLYAFIQETFATGYVMVRVRLVGVGAKSGGRCPRRQFSEGADVRWGICPTFATHDQYST